MKRKAFLNWKFNDQNWSFNYKKDSFGRDSKEDKYFTHLIEGILSDGPLSLLFANYVNNKISVIRPPETEENPDKSTLENFLNELVTFQEKSLTGKGKFTDPQIADFSRQVYTRLEKAKKLPSNKKMKDWGLNLN